MVYVCKCSISDYVGVLVAMMLLFIKILCNYDKAAKQ